MSVASRNPFALLDEAADSRPASPPPKAPAAPAPASTRGTNQKSRGGPASRGGKYYARGGAKSTQARDGPTDDSAEPAPRKFDGERGRGRGRGGRGGRGGGGGERGGRRQFDRHSATGKTDSDKKVHQGWGGDDGNRELQDETTANVDAAAEAATPADAWGAEGATSADAWGTDGAAADGSAPAADAKPDGRPPRREEEEDNTLTLDQYLAQKKEKDLAAVPKLEARKANEGATGNWKDVVPLQKGEEDAYFVGKGKSAPKARAKKEEKVFIEIDAHFERPSRGGGRGRGGDRGRGGGGRGGRGGAGRGRPNGNNNSAPTVNVDDETAFPSLS
ncbi:hypothetical protein D9758_000244 [Tetrapyrgos nigripes]|uniref:Hyaluronan/mRNA-binding protein domain-containing protein n=1 Tax=Tetrapyrgos nigripes TaxID=182062 RepID=A0A8H5LZD8_9AGAR|nr:hypothetical protein D9758_000244 [Tetrapyrgos nigripes]